MIFSHIPGDGAAGPHPLLNGSMLAFHLTLFHCRVNHKLVQLWGGYHRKAVDLNQEPPLKAQPSSHSSRLTSAASFFM